MSAFVGHIRFRTHAVHITQDADSGRVHCFKYTHTLCDIESFDDYDLAADYIALPFNSWQYVVEISDCD